MKRFALVALFCLLWAVQAQAVLVLGFVYLSGQQNHADIRVIFEAVSPSAQTDTVYTSEFGAFSATLEPGVYNVLYSHANYADYRLPNQVLLWNTNLDPVTLLPPLSGYLSGILGPGDFQVTDSIVVDSNTSLTIQPGTRLFLDGMHQFIVRGLLTAVGTEQDSIAFTRRYAVGPDTSWNGIFVLQANNQTRFEHVIVEYSVRDYGYPNMGEGAAIYCDGTDIQIRSSAFRRIAGYRSAIYLQFCAPVILQTVFEDGLLYGYAALDWYDASPIIEGCVFRDNVGNAVRGSGDGFATILGCEFRNDAAILDCSARIERCVFVGESNAEAGLNLHAVDSLDVSRCTFFGSANSGYPMLDVNGNHSISSCAVEVLAGPAVQFYHASQSLLKFCAVFAPNSEPFSYSDPSEAPPAIGLIALTNPNGDSCDTYYNIFADPQFVDTGNGDYHLTGGSPCIDAGDPALGPDPDGTVADIGAFYFDQMDTPHRDRTAVRGYGLMQNYPNPFNSTTEIVFEMPKAGRAGMAVYDITGRLVRTLFAGTAAPGRNVVSFSGDELPSGLYFCRLAAGDFRQTRKLVLMK